MTTQLADERARDLLEQLRVQVRWRNGLALAMYEETGPVGADQSAALAEAYETRTAALRADFRDTYGDPLPHGQEWRCGVGELEMIPPCRLSQSHSPAGTTFTSSFHAWRQHDMWLLVASCLAQHPSQAHYTITLGLARHGLESAGEMLA